MAKQQKEREKQNTEPTLYGPEGGAPPPAVTIDFEEFLHFLDDTHLSDEEKIECLEVHWRIICDIMSLGFNIHPVQQACGKDAETPDQPTLGASQMLESGHSETINRVGKSADDETGEGIAT